jgi:hypothetical protein
MGSADVAYARVNLFSQNERVRKYHTKALPITKFVYFIDTYIFY